MAQFPRALVLALLSASGLSSQTMAQSNVVAYGNLDVGLTKVSGEEILRDRGYNNWLGPKGQEDFGDAGLWREKTPDSRNGFALGANHTS